MVGFGLMLAVALLGAPRAHADESSHLAALARDNVDSGDTIRSLEVGHAICAQLRQGKTVYQVAREAADRAGIPFRFTYIITDDAWFYLCPDTDGKKGVAPWRLDP